MPKKKFQLALISIISFGFILILILNLGVVGNQCTNLTGLIEAHQAEEQVKVWCFSGNLIFEGKQIHDIQYTSKLLNAHLQ